MTTTTTSPSQTLDQGSGSKASTLQIKSPQRRQFHDLIRPDLQNYCPASNLAFNEKIKLLMSQGHEIYHFAFGQAPFPVVPCMVEALQEHAGEKAYLPVAGANCTPSNIDLPVCYIVYDSRQSLLAIAILHLSHSNEGERKN